MHNIDKLFKSLKDILIDGITAYPNVDVVSVNFNNNENRILFERTLSDGRKIFFYVSLWINPVSPSSSNAEKCDVTVMSCHLNENHQMVYHHLTARSTIILEFPNDDNIVENFKKKFKPFKILKTIYRKHTLTTNYKRSFFSFQLARHINETIKKFDPTLINLISVDEIISTLTIIVVRSNVKNFKTVFGIDYVDTKKIPSLFYDKIKPLYIIENLEQILNFFNTNGSDNIAVLSKISHSKAFGVAGFKSLYTSPSDTYNSCLIVSFENDKQCATLSLLEHDNIIIRYKKHDELGKD